MLAKDTSNKERTSGALNETLWYSSDHSKHVEYTCTFFFFIVAKMDHTRHDCLVVVALSHGGQGFLDAKDSKYPRNSLLTPFTADKCSSLKGKPKLFFIQVSN